MFRCQTLLEKMPKEKQERLKEFSKSDLPAKAQRAERQRNALAQTLGENLGTGKVLLGALPSK